MNYRAGMSAQFSPLIQCLREGRFDACAGQDGPNSEHFRTRVEDSQIDRSQPDFEDRRRMEVVLQV
jgi:hypothetical protein